MYRIYRAEVVDIIPDNKRDGVFDIYIREYEEAEGSKRKALPPSPIATSTVGGGMLSYPEIGQECLVAENVGRDPVVQILTYTTTRFANPFGALSGEKFTGFMMKIGGMTKSVLSLEDNGNMGLFSHAWASLSLSGGDSSFALTTKTYKRISKVGLEEDTFNGDRTGYLWYKTQYAQSPMSPEYTNAQENLPFFPAIEPFVGQVIVRAGSIPNLAHSDDGMLSHVYELETRQATSRTKNVFTKLKLGLQKDSKPFSNSTVSPGGTILEWTQKHAAKGARILRYGELAGGDLLGEIYRHNIVHDNQYGLPYTEGEGYGDEYPDSKAGQQLFESFGKLSDGSVWRRHIHGNGASLTELLSGSNTYSHEVVGASVTSKVTVGENFKLDVSVGDTHYVITMSSDGLKIDTNGQTLNLGGSSGAQKLATEQFVTTTYNNHVHPTGVGPSGSPIPQAVPGDLTDITKAD